MSGIGLRLFVVVATVGRAALTARTVDFLYEQTRRPDGVVVVGVSESDVVGVREVRTRPNVIFGARGLCKQRNRALEELEGHADVIIFFDDDFVPALNYLEEIENIFSEDVDVVGSTGVLVADGIHNSGYEFSDALAQIASKASEMPPSFRYMPALYGCNMVIRTAAAAGMTFDERLPLYGWQEDVDFTFRLGKRGKLIKTSRTTGVHLGTKGGRTSGLKLGYSQVANVIYLLKKGTMPPKLGRQLLLRNIASNLLRSFSPEPHIDRRGRAMGNLLALSDFLRRRLDPLKIETM